MNALYCECMLKLEVKVNFCSKYLEGMQIYTTFASAFG